MTPQGYRGVASHRPIRDTSGVRLLVACVLLLPGVAAASDGESAASIGVGGGTWILPHPEEEDETLGPAVGGAIVGIYERGFSEALSWRLELSGALYGRDGLSWSGGAAGGLVYRFDVLKYVPYAILELGVTALGGGPVPDADAPVIDPVVQIGGGLDVLLDRSSSWGIEARVASFAGDTTIIAVTGRYTWRWGYF